MRIAYLTPHWSATTGGPSKYVERLRTNLEERGHTVTVITTDSGDGADVVAGSFPIRDARAVRLLRRFDPDIVHVHGSMRFLLSALAHRFLRSSTRVVFTFHTQPSTDVFLAGHKAHPRDYSAGSALVARALLRSADLVTSVSDSIVTKHNEAYHLGIRRHVRIPSGGDPWNVSGDREGGPNIEQEDDALRGYPLLVSVGVMAWDWKVAGHLVAIRAVDKLRAHYPTVKLVIAGDGPHRGLIEREVATLRLQDHVRLLGTVSPERLLKVADLYVHMAMAEGCSLAIIEAMHAGKPIIAANRAGIPEVLVNEESAVLIEPEPDRLAIAVQDLMSDSERRGRLAARAREVALREYTWPAVAARYAAVYQSLLIGGETGRIAANDDLSRTKAAK
jgi:glycosyltransferase involved in cell wall biosynthesis